MTPRTGIGERYATALGELWTSLSRTLRRLEAVAADPDALDDEAVVSSLRGLQYGLHVAHERVYGLRPPASAVEAHADLAAALAGARSATAEVAEAASFGGAVAVEPLLHEWRGALFAVRLARLRFADGRAPAAPLPAAAEPHAGVLRPLLAVLLALLGALAFVLGAVTGLWPVWAAGLGSVAASLLVYRP